MIDQTPAISPDPYLEEVLMAGRGEDGSETEANEQVVDKRDEEVAEGVDPEGQDANEDSIDEEHDAAEGKVLPDPGEPTASQVEDHRANGHIPYRSWCRECVAGRGAGEQHRRRIGDRAVCVLFFDYLFLDASWQKVERNGLSEDRSEVDLTILVVRDSKGKSLFGHVVP